MYLVFELESHYFLIRLKMETVYKCAVLLCLFSSFSWITCQTVEDFPNIYENITKGYIKEVIPISEPSQPLKIYLQTYLSAFYNLGESDETITITALVDMYWRDVRLRWDPNGYKNTSHLIISTDGIWTPFLYLINSAENVRPVGDENQYYAYVSNEGDIHWSPGEVMTAKCRMDLSKFPFDEQTCLFIFGIWTVPTTDIKTISSTDKAIITYFIPTSDWEVTSYKQYIVEIEDGNGFVLELSVKRQPLYNIVVIIFPTLLFSLMNPLVFLLPVDSGERVSLGMTLLLSYAIFLTLVASSVPVSSNPMCVLLVVMVLIMVLSGLLVVFIIVSLYYYHIEDTSDVFSCVKRLTLTFRKGKEKYTEGEATKSECSLSGKDISKVLDIFFLIISYITLIGMNAAYFIFVFAT